MVRRAREPRIYAQELAELKHKVSVAQDQVTAFRQKSGVTDATAQATNVESDLLTSLEQRYQEAQNQRRAAEVAASGNRTASTAVMGSNLIQGLKDAAHDEEQATRADACHVGPGASQGHRTAEPNGGNASLLGRRIGNLFEQYFDGIDRRPDSSNKSWRPPSKNSAPKCWPFANCRMKARNTCSSWSPHNRCTSAHWTDTTRSCSQSGEHYTNVNFVSRAVARRRRLSNPTSQNCVLMGAFAGLFLGLAAPFAYEVVLHRRVRCRDDFERAFGLPVLSEFDAIKPAPSAA